MGDSLERDAVYALYRYQIETRGSGSESRESRLLGEVLAGCLGDNGRHRALGLRTVRVNGPDGKRIALLVTTVCLRCKLDYCVQRDLDVW